MRISDWSSDVCSSDLRAGVAWVVVSAGQRALAAVRQPGRSAPRWLVTGHSGDIADIRLDRLGQRGDPDYLGALSAAQKPQLRPASADRKSTRLNSSH